MGLEEKMDSFILNSSQFQGKVLAWMDNTDKHLDGVHDKLNLHLSDHLIDAKEAAKEQPKLFKDNLNLLATLAIGLGTIILAYMEIKR